MVSGSSLNITIDTSSIGLADLYKLPDDYEMWTTTSGYLTSYGLPLYIWRNLQDGYYELSPSGSQGLVYGVCPVVCIDPTILPLTLSNE